MKKKNALDMILIMGIQISNSMLRKQRRFGVPKPIKYGNSRAKVLAINPTRWLYYVKPSTPF